MRRTTLLQKMLAQFGIEKERVKLDWVSASEGDRFAFLINEMTEQIRKLGPLSLKVASGEQIQKADREAVHAKA
jgi:F420-non-reducing hydrogenase iron-sulfur subunit